METDCSLESSAAIPAAFAVSLAPDHRRRFFADVLLWTVREGSAENWAQTLTPSSLSENGTGTLVGAPFDWRPGFRVGVGVQRDRGFDVTLYYTNFHTSATAQASGEVYSAFMGNFYVDNTDGGQFGPYYEDADVQWEFAFHSIDFEVGRNCMIGTNLTLRPFVGLKAAIIHQSVETHWRNPINTTEHTYAFTSATESLKPQFWGIGPSLGVTMAMPLHDGEKSSLRLFGSPSGALMFGNWTCSEVYRNDQSTSVTIDMSPITSAATMLRGVVGLEWERHFARTVSTVRFGYEAQVWLNQIQFYSYNMGRLNNAMSLQGGFAEWSVRF